LGLPGFPVLIFFGRPRPRLTSSLLSAFFIEVLGSDMSSGLGSSSIVSFSSILMIPFGVFHMPSPCASVAFSLLITAVSFSVFVSLFASSCSLSSSSFNFNGALNNSVVRSFEFSSSMNRTSLLLIIFFVPGCQSL